MTTGGLLDGVDGGGFIFDVASSPRFVADYDFADGSRLIKLYGRAQEAQWNVDRDLDWSTTVDEEAIAAHTAEQPPWLVSMDAESVLRNWDPATRASFAMESQRWVLSQFLHTEQAAMLCASHLLMVTPTIDAKLFLSTQATDGARHAVAFGRYIKGKLGGEYPIDRDLRDTVHWSIEDARWDLTCLGMQVLIEGTALAAFSFLHQTGTEPLLRQILRYVMADEARHVAFGVLALEDLYAMLTDSELLERQEFVLECVLAVRRRYLQREVWDRFGVDVTRIAPTLAHSDGYRGFEHALFSRVVPTCEKLGLLDANNGWLRQRLTPLVA